MTTKPEYCSSMMNHLTMSLYKCNHSRCKDKEDQSTRQDPSIQRLCNHDGNTNEDEGVCRDGPVIQPYLTTRVRQTLSKKSPGNQLQKNEILLPKYKQAEFCSCSTFADSYGPRRFNRKKQLIQHSVCQLWQAELNYFN